MAAMRALLDRFGVTAALVTGVALLGTAAAGLADVDASLQLAAEPDRVELVRYAEPHGYGCPDPGPRV